MTSFAIGTTEFLLDDQPFRILSGSVHYFRVHPGQWRDRIRKAKSMGLNTIETYVAWNAHCRTEGYFKTDEELDVVRFLQIVADEGMFAIVRPGPFICAEWHNGGLPTWLTQRCGGAIRQNQPAYMAAVAEYFSQLLPLLAPLQVEEGGPIILMQVENEYGAYGSDSSYLRILVDLLRSHKISVPLTTIDQPTDAMLSAGGLPDVHKTASFGSGARTRLATLRAHQPEGPLMCAEFWDGWFDHWGGHHATTDAGTSARELDEILAAGASVNIYMAHGGTNWGFTNGANHKGYYQPTVTSYDYDAPIGEAGELTEKFFAFREVLGRYGTLPAFEDEVPADSPAFSAAFTHSLPLRDFIDSTSVANESFLQDGPPSFDEIGLSAGFGWYRATLDGESARRGGVLEIGEVRDRAQVFLGGRPVGVFEREHNDRRVVLPAWDGGDDVVLDVLVEDQGRVNYGSRIGEEKGLIGPVLFDGKVLQNWRLEPVDFSDLPELASQLIAPSVSSSEPVLKSLTFTLEEASDLFLSTRNFGKGAAWLNGWPLGRFWSRGPQHTLFVPEPATCRGGNSLLVLELTGVTTEAAVFLARPDLGPTES